MIAFDAINHNTTRTQAPPDYPANTTLLGINWHVGKKEPRQLLRRG